MIFSDIKFLLFFVFVMLFLSFGTQKYKKIAILILSYLFYAFGSLQYLLILILSTIIDFILGNILYKTTNNKKKKFLLILSICQNIGILFFFKYINFFIDYISNILSIIGFSVSPFTLNIILPIGISFYTFQKMSYCIDIYNKKIVPTKHFIDFANFVAFFPQLIAGPIETTTNFLPQIEKFNGFSKKKLKEGLWLILIGYIRKVLIADTCAIVISKYFLNPSYFSSNELIIVSILFSLQLYFDFSGYSNIAIGLAKLFNIDLVINFKQPFFSTNISEFWKRWHISLTTWIKNYIYIPLGGNRCSNFRNILNIMIVMLLCGFWHGANYTFILWGAIHSIYIILYKYFLKKLFKLPNIINILFVNIIIIFSFIIFRSSNIYIAYEYILTIFNFGGNISYDIIICLLYSVSCLLLLDIPAYKTNDETAFFSRTPVWFSIPISIICIILILVSIVKHLNNTIPFIYFSF